MKLALCLALLFSFNVFAQESSDGQSSTQIDNLQRKNKNDIDKEIKSKYLRAKSGSKRTWSGSANLSYSGGAITRPFAETRPSIYDDVNGESRTSIGGDISARYRMDKHNSFSLGTGLSIYTPFHGDTDKEDSQMDVNNPFVSYSRVYRWRFLQNITSLSVSQATTDFDKTMDRKGAVTLSQNALTMIDKWTIGTAIGVTYNKYGENSSPFISEKYFFEWMVMASPYASYRINDKWAARTFVSVLNFSHYKNREDKSAFNMDKLRNWMTLGVSYSLTRDVFLYPNVLFNPTNTSAKRTHLGLSATINL